MIKIEKYYGNDYAKLVAVKEALLRHINNYKEYEGSELIEYVESRIKSPESANEKLVRKGFPTGPQSAMLNLCDLVGIRLVCGFLEDVYQVVDWIKSRSDVLEIIKEKDYIKNPKDNGYRSYHIIVRLKNEIVKDIKAEIQIRTIAIDFWATLEHKLKYKKEIKNEEKVSKKLKWCADSVHLLDEYMQDIKETVEEAELSFEEIYDCQCPDCCTLYSSKKLIKNNITKCPECGFDFYD